MEDLNKAKIYRDSFLSDRVYENDPEKPKLVEGEPTFDKFGNEYKVLKISDTASSYQGYAFQDVSTGEVVIAHRGTQEKLDAVADWDIGVGNVPQQVQDAIAFNQRVLDKLSAEAGMSIDPSTINQTGHSLGGGIGKVA